MQIGAVVIVLVLAGIAAGVSTSMAAVKALAAALAFASIALLFGDLALSPVWWRVRRAIVLAACVAAAVAYGAHARDTVLRSPIVDWLEARPEVDPRTVEPVTMRGTLIADAQLRNDGVRLEVAVTGLDGDGNWRSIAGRVQAHVSGTMAASKVRDWVAGRRIEAPITLRRAVTYLNPGGESPEWQARRRPFDLTGAIKSATLVRVESGPIWHEAAAAVRRHVRDVARRYLAPRDSQAAAIVTAILIGDRAGLSRDVEDRLQAAGTYHVIAISGGNIALLTIGCLFVLRAITRSHRLSSIATLLVIVAYGSVVGSDPSVRRAVLAASVYLVVDLIGWTAGAMRVVGVVALIVVLVDPLTIIDVGAWLSFGATVGIIAGATHLASRLPVTSRLLRAIAGLGAATIAAELALVPIQAVIFNRITVAGLVLNFVAIPAMAMVQVLGGLLMLAATFSHVIANMLAKGAVLATQLLTGSTYLVTIAPWLSWRTPPSSCGWVAAYYAAWGILLAGRIGPGRRRVAAAVAAIAILKMIAIPTVWWQRPPTGWLRMTAIDVGQGDAILLQLPSGRAMLVDAGGTPTGFDIGRRVVTPAIWALGVTRLDWLVFTHADGDHIGGALSVARDLRPREIWEGVPVAGQRDVETLREEADTRGASWRRVSAGQAVEIGGVLIRAVHPIPPDWERRRVRNDDSLVLSVEYRDVQFLLTGDAATEFEGVSTQLRTPGGRSPPPLRVLKVAHHGSRTSTSAPFVDNYRPEIAIVSVGRGNLFGHPAPEVVGRLESIRTDLFRTDRDGAIMIETDGRRVVVRTMQGARWQVSAAPAWPPS